MADDDFVQNPDNDSAAPDGLMSTPLPKEDHPFSEPDDIPSAEKQALDDTHPATDKEIQPEEEYDEGLSGAAEAAEPNQGNAVKGYNPDQDSRRQ